MKSLYSIYKLYVHNEHLINLTITTVNNDIDFISTFVCVLLHGAKPSATMAAATLPQSPRKMDICLLDKDWIRSSTVVI